MPELSIMPGTITLFGSGETSNMGGQVFEALARQATGPLNISVLETPAGFEVNAEQVAGRISDFLHTRLQNYQPHLRQVAARKKGTPYSPDSPEIVAPLYESNLIFLGPGSPTYTVRQLQDSLAWHILQARHRLGASLVFASAATIAAGSPALPVYEIYKVGEDPHWKPGLDLCGPFGLDLVIIPHWNNRDGGDALDTSHCFIGQSRFEQLLTQLPAGKTILGIDELTAITLDFRAGACHVSGMGSIHLLHSDQDRTYPAGSHFSLDVLGDYLPLSNPKIDLPHEVWQRAQQAMAQMVGRIHLPANQNTPEIPPELQPMIEARQLARRQRDWTKADLLRQEIAALGWRVIDSPDGPRIEPIK